MPNLFSGRRRYALACLVVFGGLVTAAASCAPTKEPVKPEAPTGLSIEPALHTFADEQIGGAAGTTQTFTVTNHGPGATGLLEVTKDLFDPQDFLISNDNCDGTSVAENGTCTIDVTFDPQGGNANIRQANLVVDDPDDGGVEAGLAGFAFL